MKIQDVECLFTPDQMSALVTLLADAETIYSHYLGSSVPEPVRWKKRIKPCALEGVKFAAMDDVTYDALVLVTKLHLEAEASK